jgi:hypothetical protein
MLVHRDAQGNPDHVLTAEGTSVDNNRDGSVDTMNSQGYTTQRDAQGNVVQTNPDGTTSRYRQPQ